jgi:hypothetical protein
LEIYLKKILEFVYGSPTSIKTLCQDEETKAGPNGIVEEEEVQIEEQHEFRRWD